MRSAAPIWSDEYTGPRWTYGLTYRPLAYAQIPSGWLIKSDRAHPAFKFGTVDYPRELSELEVSHAEVTLLSAPLEDLPDTCIGCGTPESTIGGRFCKACRS